MRTIQYAIDSETGLVWSRVGDACAVPVLDFEGMKPENKYEMAYDLKKIPVLQIAGGWHYLKWTRKIPTKVKNFHRAFWGMKPLRMKRSDYELVQPSSR
jgi:hypothetical protein